METYSEFTRPHHRRIERLLRKLPSDKLRRMECFFGGGTALALQCGEYRESVDIDFLCNNRDGYRELRTGIHAQGAAFLFADSVKLASDLRSSRDAVRCSVDMCDGLLPLKVEFIMEGYLAPLGPGPLVCGVSALARSDSIATKLLANTDRGMDKAHGFRDFFDIAMACNSWRKDAAEGFAKASAAYGTQVITDGVLKVGRILEDNAIIDAAFDLLGISDDIANELRQSVARLQGVATPALPEAFFL